MSLKSDLHELAKRHYPKWLNGGEFERFAMDNGYKASNSSRRARELVKEGSLERRIGERGSVEYLYKVKMDYPPVLPQYKVERPLEKTLW